MIFFSQLYIISQLKTNKTFVSFSISEELFMSQPHCVSRQIIYCFALSYYHKIYDKSYNTIYYSFYWCWPMNYLNFLSLQLIMLHILKLGARKRWILTVHLVINCYIYDLNFNWVTVKLFMFFTNMIFRCKL